MTTSRIDDRLVLGLGGSDHDFSAALMRGSDIEVAVESERLSRIKYGAPPWFGDPVLSAADYCLDTARATRDDVVRVVSSDLLPQRTIDRWGVRTYSHHLCHAASSVMLLPPETRACILVYDGAGSMGTAESRHRSMSAYETFSFYELVEGQLHRLGQTRGQRYVEPFGLLDGGTNSIGSLYELITSYVSFERKEAGKTMGLAAWGEPRSPPSS